MTITELNTLLGQELGLNPRGEPIFKWEWSEDLFWPAYATGQMTVRPIPGSVLVAPQPEYIRDRQAHNLKDQWVITKWISPQQLVNHWRWHEKFPGAGVPSEGYRLKTDWYNKPGVQPTLDDTRCCIWALRKQMPTGYNPANPDAHGISEGQRLRREMEEEMDQRDASVQREINDEVLDSFGAFLNPAPGKRGNFVSFPSTSKDMKEISNG
jgi:hypothetical protein